MMTHVSDFERSIGSMMRDLNALDAHAYYRRYGCTHQKAVVDILRTRELDYPSGERCQQMLAEVMSRPIEESGHLDLVPLLHLSRSHEHSAIRSWVDPESIMRHVSRHILASAGEGVAFTRQHALQAYTLFEACTKHPAAGALLVWYPEAWDCPGHHPLAILDKACWDTGSAYLMQRVLKNGEAILDSTRQYITSQLHRHFKRHLIEQPSELLGLGLSQVECVDYSAGISTVVGRYLSDAGCEFKVSMDIDWRAGQISPSAGSAGMSQAEKDYAEVLLQGAVGQVVAASGVRVIAAYTADTEPDMLSQQDQCSHASELRG
ncbi:hypothetical protein [Marinobacterium sp. BA1]|uniref:hypothetical protein n=1 Tax=Marinobacterium sp. BA1 TaxID=3138931 RepID=UPI0032E5C3D2